MTIRRFQLHRDEDETGISGTGVVAEGALFSDGMVVLRWTTQWPTSTVFHDRGMDAVKHIHGHNGKTRIVWLDEEDDDVAQADRFRNQVARTTPTRVSCLRPSP